MILPPGRQPASAVSAVTTRGKRFWPSLASTMRPLAESSMVSPPPRTTMGGPPCMVLTIPGHNVLNARIKIGDFTVKLLVCT